MQVNQSPGSRSRCSCQCQTATQWRVHVMYRRQWQTCGFCVSVWAGLHRATGHMFGLCLEALSWRFLGVTCAFLSSQGETCGWRDVYSGPDYIFCIQLSVLANATTEKQEKEGKSGSFLLMENMLSFTPNISLLFVSFLLPSALGFFFF